MVIRQHGGVTTIADEAGATVPASLTAAPASLTAAPAAWPGPPEASGGAGRSQPSVQFAGVADVLRPGQVVILSGAGLSTESGIPDYRGPTGLARRAEPMSYQTFTGSAAARQRYWARSYLGWRHVARASPNAGHQAVAELQQLGLLAGIITQNVDGLHQAAGADQVVELHGSLDRVACLGCRARSPRAELDRRLRAANPGWHEQATALRPDGDAVLDDSQTARFRIVDCLSCGGVLKPDVVFFGENVPKPTVEYCYELVSQARALAVLGSSLTVMSGYRFVRHAARLGVPVVIVNQGATRGDALATLTLDAPLGQALTALVTLLASSDCGSNSTAAISEAGARRDGGEAGGPRGAGGPR
jgi:NAD-dependent SIR2 family protein deacetylase